MRTSAGIVAPSTHWKRVSLRDRRCLIMLSSIPRRLSSDVLLAPEPAARRASICQALAIVHAQGFCRLEIGFVFSKITQVSAKFTVQHSEHVSVRPVEKAAHSAPRELLTTRRILREFQASTETVEDSPRKMFGCAAMIT